MNTVLPSPRVSVSPARYWVGPALLFLSAGQYLLGDTLLTDYATRALVSTIGLFLVMTSPTIFMAGLGESLNVLMEIFSRRN